MASHLHLHLHLQRFCGGLPRNHRLGYFTEPSAEELAERECQSPGFCSRVPDFVVGRSGFGQVRFFGNTDVRFLEVEKIIEFGLSQISVYSDERLKPPLGQGLNKPAEVTLLVQKSRILKRGWEEELAQELKGTSERQGAEFVSFDANKREWRFRVPHFSRFGLFDEDEDEKEGEEEEEEEEEEERNRDRNPQSSKGLVVELQEEKRRWNGENMDTEEAEEDEIMTTQEAEEDQDDDVGSDGVFHSSANRVALPHSLPEKLGLDPVKMQEMRMLFVQEEEDMEEDQHVSGEKLGFRSRVLPKNVLEEEPGSRFVRAGSVHRNSQTSWQISPYKGSSKQQQRLFGYQHKDSAVSPLMTHQSKAEFLAPKKPRLLGGFRLETAAESPVAEHHRNVVDAGLFMGRSFRVGWGPNGVFYHCGIPVGHSAGDGEFCGLSSEVHIQIVAIDRSVRDKEENVSKELVEMQFVAPLRLHKSLSSVCDTIGEEFSGKMKLRKVDCSRSELPDLCSGYVDCIEKQLTSASEVSRSKEVLLMHQAVVWGLIRVLFADRRKESLTNLGKDEQMDVMEGVRNDENVDMEDDVRNDENEGMEDVKNGENEEESSGKRDVKNEENHDGERDVDPEAEPLMRRAAFSGWLQDSVYHRVSEDISNLEDGNELKRIFSLLSGKQLEEAVQLAAYRGDVRLACLISQAGGPMMNRHFMAEQLKSWEEDGLDFSFMEDERLRLFKLLAGDIQGSLGDTMVDWKRYLGLLMWYHLPPESSIPSIVTSFEQLVVQGQAPEPVPIYIDEGPSEESGSGDFSSGSHYDFTYYLMLLHAKQGLDDRDLRKMFSSFSSTYDALDYCPTWHQQSILQAIGAIDSKNLHIVYMSFVSQLLCVGECHWAIYVVLHMPLSPSCPKLHEKVIKDILFQYCDTWNGIEAQKQFLKELGIPAEWMHEALAISYQYKGDHIEALDHLLKSFQWQKAHSVFMSSVAPTLFCSSRHVDVLKIAKHMEIEKAEIADWDLGAGIFVTYYTLKDWLNKNDSEDDEEDMKKRTAICRDFFTRLNQSLALWKSKFPLNARVMYTIMADNVADWLLPEEKRDTISQVSQVNCFNTILDAPVPEDLRQCRLQDAASEFSSWIVEITS